MSLAPLAGPGPDRPGDRLVIFDCDGVLVDSEVLVSVAEAELLAEVGVDLSPEQISEQFVGLSEPEMARRIQRDWGVVLDERFSRTKAETVAHLLSTRLQPVGGIAAVLSGLRAKMCVASSSNPERVELSLHKTGLAGFFGGNVFTASMVPRGKPAPDLFLLAARTMGCPPSRCVVVEDSPYGVMAAVSAAMDVIGFTGGGHCNPGTPARLRRAGATKLAASAEQLGPLLRAALAGV